MSGSRDQVVPADPNIQHAASQAEGATLCIARCGSVRAYQLPLGATCKDASISRNLLA